MEHEITCRFADPARDPGSLLRQSVASALHSDNAVVVRPDGAILIRKGTEGWTLFGKFEGDQRGRCRRISRAL